MTHQQLSDLSTVVVMGVGMFVILAVAALVERRKEIVRAREADAIEAHENHIIESWFPGVRDELRPGR